MTIEETSTMDSTTSTAPDGRTHFLRATAAGVDVLVWHGQRVGDPPHPDAFIPAAQVPDLAGMTKVRLPRFTGRISAALTGWCADRLLPVARVDGVLMFQVAAVQAWLAAEGLEKLGEWVFGGNVVPFPRGR